MQILPACTLAREESKALEQPASGQNGLSGLGAMAVPAPSVIHY